MTDFTYHRKPATIEAVQWNGTKLDAVPQWLNDAIKRGPMRRNGVARVFNDIDVWSAIGSVSTAKPGDWLTWENGSLGTCKDAIFTTLYDAQPDLRAPVVRMAHDQLALEIERLRRDCGEAYQVIGAGMFLDPVAYTQDDVERAMDNLNAAANGAPRPHDDLLPWPKPAQALQLSAEGCTKPGCCPNPGACEAEAGEQGVAQELVEHCRQFIRDQGIHGPETIYQCDGVVLNALEFVQGVCDIVGYEPIPNET
jgi:hypothetical protein